MMKPILPSSPAISLFYCSEENLALGLIKYQMQHRSINLYDIERNNL